MKKNLYETFILAMFPLSTFVLCLLANFVRIGFRAPSESFWLDTAITTLMQMAFFLSFKTIFKKNRSEDARIADLEKLYRLQYNAYIENAMHAKLLDYTKTEQDARINSFIDEHLFRAGIDVADYTDNYKYNVVAVLKSKLPFTVKTELWKCRNWKKIKRVRVDKLLPNIGKWTVFDPIGKDDAGAERRITLQKFLLGIAISFAFSSIALMTDFSNDVLASIMSLVIKFVMGFWQIFMAKMSTKMLNQIYLEKIASKTTYFDDFFSATSFDFSEYLDKHK